MTPEQQKLRDKLYQSKDIFKNISALKSYIKENEKILSGTDDPEIKLLITQQNEALNQDYKRLIEIRLKIDKCISSIDDEQLRSFMTAKYLGHLDVFELAEQMFWAPRTCDRKHIAALQKILDSGADKYLDY